MRNKKLHIAMMMISKRLANIFKCNLLNIRQKTIKQLSSYTNGGEINIHSYSRKNFGNG